MRLSASRSRIIARSFLQPPRLILLGLIVLTMGVLWPTTPVVAAVALVGLGATLVTSQLFRLSPARGPLLVVHLALYGGLYLLFVGAAFDAATRSGERLSSLATLDLAASLIPLAATLFAAVGALNEVGPE